MSSERPAKRQRLEPPSRPIPPEVLLLNLPSLLAHPQNHPNHVPSLLISLEALKKCVTLAGIEPEIECRAWTGIAEIAIMLNKVDVAEKAISKGLVIAQRHPSLKLYYPRLILLSARVTSTPKFAQTTLRRFLSGASPSLPIHFVYTAHLDLISSLSLSIETTKTLAAIQAFEELAQSNTHKPMVDLAVLLRLQTLVNAGRWSDIQNALPPLSSVAAPPSLATLSSSQHIQELMNPIIQAHILILMVIYHTYTGSSEQAVATLKELHLLLDSGVVLPPSSSKSSSPTHQKTDGSKGVAAQSGIIEVFPGVWIQSTHPRVLNLLVFLVTSVAKRDPVGRKPKKRVFAREGLAVLEREKERERKYGSATHSATWTALGANADPGPVEDRMERIKADLLCELVSIAVARCEFEEAEQVLSTLIAHTKSIPLSSQAELPPDTLFQPPTDTTVSPTKSKKKPPQTPTRPSQDSLPTLTPASTQTLFHSYASRITLHQAHLAHARGKTERARQCYRVAMWLSCPEDDHAAANVNQPRVKFDAIPSKSRGKTKPGGGKTKGKGKAKGRGGRKDETPTKSPVEEEFSEPDEMDEGRRGDPWVHACARAGDIALRIGELAQKRVDRIQLEKEKRREVRRKPQQDSDWEVDMSSEPAYMFPPPTNGLGGDSDEDEDGAELLRELQMEAKEEEDIQKVALEVAEECEGLGGVLCAVGEVLRSCVSEEYLKGKNYLRNALQLCTSAQDNHLRALVMALVAARYMYTAREHAEGMLRVCETLGAGVGATPSLKANGSMTSVNGTGSQSQSQPKDGMPDLESQSQSQSQDAAAQSQSQSQTKPPPTQNHGGDQVGNARLRYWVGERLLELHKWAGEQEKATKQKRINDKFKAAIERQAVEDGDGAACA